MTIMPVDSDPPVQPAAAVDLGPLPGLIGYALRRAQVAVVHDLQRHFAEADIRPAQFSVLLVLKHNPGLRATQVAAALGIKRTNFVAVLDELERRGFARRQAVADDRRSRRSNSP